MALMVAPDDGSEFTSFRQVIDALGNCRNNRGGVYSAVWCIACMAVYCMGCMVAVWTVYYERR